jgi:hypothetical protein
MIVGLSKPKLIKRGRFRVWSNSWWIRSEAFYFFRMFVIKLRYLLSLSILKVRNFIVKAKHLGFRLVQFRIKFILLRLKLTNYVEYFFIILVLAKALKQLGDVLEDRAGSSGIRDIHLNMLNALVSDFNHKSHTESTPTPFDFI